MPGADGITVNTREAPPAPGFGGLMMAGAGMGLAFGIIGMLFGR